MLLPQCSPEAAQRYGELLRASAAAHVSRLGDQAVSVTISVGIAHWRGVQDSLERLMNRADQALYDAKVQGRDRVAVSPD